MDLVELGKAVKGNLRHPWEQSRLNFIIHMLGKYLQTTPASILDIGSGDAFVLESLADEFPDSSLTGLDVYLSKPTAGTRFTVYNRQSDIHLKPYNLITLFDLLEHIEDDAKYLKGFVDDYMEAGSTLFITVPMHQYLFSEHDRFLKHFRRYSLASLKNLASDSGLETIKSGQFFASLYLARFLQKFIHSGGDAKGVAGWGGGKVSTVLITAILDIDWRFFSFLPGLSGYLLLRKT